MTSPKRVTVGGMKWPLVFDIGALLVLGERMDQNEPGFGWMQGAVQRLLGGDVKTVVAFLHAGLLHKMPDLTPDEALDLLEGASWPELARLPKQVFEAFQAYLPGDDDRREGEGGEWDWDKALAIWVAEWGRPESEFKATALPSYASIGRGLSRLYGPQEEHGGGMTLMDLERQMSTGGLRR